MKSVLVFLFLPISAFAMGSRGATISHFKSCKYVGGANAPACAPIKHPVNSALPQASEDLSDNAVLHRAFLEVRGSAEAIVDRSLRAREKMLDCLDSPTADCQERVAKLTAMLEKRVKALRIMLLMAKPAGLNTRDRQLMDRLGGGLDPFTAREMSLSLELPTFAGGQGLPTATPQELFEADEIRARLLAGMAGDSPRLSKSPSIPEKDRPAYLQKEAADAATRVLLEMPLVAKFDHLPILKSELRDALRASRKTIYQWQKDVLDPDSEADFVFNFETMFEKHLQEHPEDCRAIERAYLAGANSKLMKDSLWAASKTAFIGTLCVATEGVACIAVGAMVEANDAVNSVLEAQNIVARKSSLGDLSPQGLAKNADEGEQILKRKDVANARTDMMWAIAFDGFGLVPVAAVAKSSALLRKSADKVVQDVGESIAASGEGRYVSKATEKLRDGAKSATQMGASSATHQNDRPEVPSELGGLVYDQFFSAVAP